jgi:hypothetical protein
VALRSFRSAGSVLCPAIASPYQAAFALSQHCTHAVAAPLIELSQDDELYNSILDGYSTDLWCIKVSKTTMDGLKRCGAFLYYNARLVIPRANNLLSVLAVLAHNALGHFGFDKTYVAMRDTFYWPGMRSFLENMYISSCNMCQRIKSPTTRPAGPLHLLPVAEKHIQTVTIDFVGLFPEENNCDYILTMTDQLGADVRLIPCKTMITA